MSTQAVAGINGPVRSNMSTVLQLGRGKAARCVASTPETFDRHCGRETQARISRCVVQR